jgi:hypothetical protein
MAVLQNGSKCSHTKCMLRFFTVSRLALNTNLIFEMGYSNTLAFWKYYRSFEIDLFQRTKWLRVQQILPKLPELKKKLTEIEKRLKKIEKSRTKVYGEGKWRKFMIFRK